MKIIETTFERLPRERLVIGFEGENLRATVRIDCASVFAEYPNATPSLIVKPLFADAYPVVVDRNGTCVDWLITSEILSFNGDGEIQLVFYKDQVICKSAVSKIRVSRSLQATGEKPDPIARWEDAANQKLAEVDAVIVSIDEMDATAHGLPEGSAPTVEVTEVDDHKRISFGIPKGDKGEKGEQGIQGEKGEKGDKGDRGEQGIQGIQGERGEKGEKGDTGAQGLKGDKGDRGEKGEQGIQGEQGVQGPKGDPGDGTPAGGLTDQVLAKASDTDRDTKWMYVAPVVKNEASGSIASFPDGADGHPIDELKVAIEPVQDLHGYDHPWPAGGGKNLLQILPTESTVSNGVTFTVNADGTISTQGTASGTAVFRHYITASDLPAGEDLALNGVPSGGGWVSRYGLAFCSANGAVIGAADSGSGTTISASYLSELAQVQIVVRDGINANGKLFTPMIRLASITDSSFAPYSNICPITGWDGVQVWDDPVHGGLIEWNQQCDVLAIDGDTSNLAFTFGNNGSVKITGTSNKADWKNIKMFTDKSEHLLLAVAFPAFPEGFSLGQSYSDTRRSHMFMYATGNQYLRFSFTGGTVMDYDGYVNIFDLTQMFGDTKANEINSLEQATYGAGLAYFKSLFPADYYPYNAGEITTVSAVNGDPYRHYSITLPTEAGTVYGGTLDVSTGELVVDRAIVELSALTWTRYRSFYYAPVPILGYNTALLDMLMSDTYETVIYSDVYNASKIGIAKYSGQDCLALYDPALIDNISAVSGAVVYPFATPLTYTLIPTQIRTLLGQNNIWSDAGDVSVEYNADTKLYIDNKITQAIAAALNS